MENRMTYLQQNHPKWCNGYLLIENGHCLIEDEEGDIMLPESLQSSMICLKKRIDGQKENCSGLSFFVRMGS